MKKFLSLVLALVMTMSLVTVSAGAKDFTDADDITYVEAVEVMSAISVVDGDTAGNFNPTNGLTRGAAAKIICNLILGPTTAAELNADTNPYPDVDKNSTFAGYIAYCQKEGIISGYADGTFKPANPLTGYAFMKMLLGALGYDANVEGYTGANWSINVAKQAIGIGLEDGLVEDFNGSDFVNREEAMLYAYNTLLSTMVEYEAKTEVSVGDANVVIAGSKAYPVSWDEGIKNDGNIDPDGMVQFAEKHFANLELDVDSDAFMCPADVWTLKGKEIGTYTWEADEVYTTRTTSATIYKDLGLSSANTVKGYYVDGAKQSAILLEKGNVRDENKVGGQGVTTYVYYDSKTDVVTICEVNTYVGEISGAYAATANKDAYVVVAQREWNDAAGDTDPYATLVNFAGNSTFTTDIFKAEEIVLFTYSNKPGSVGIQSLELAETVEGELTNYTTDTEAFVGGTTYKYAAKIAAEATAVLMNKAVDAVVVLDQYGNAIDITDNGVVNYAVVLKVKTEAGTYGDARLAQLLLTDGTVVDVTLANRRNGTNTVTDGTNTIDADDLVSFAINNKGQYDLTEVADSTTSQICVDNGVSGIDKDNDGTDDYNANGKTIFLVKTGTVTDPIYTAYTGIKAVPTITTSANVTNAVFCKTAPVANVIYIDAQTNATVATTDVIFVKAPTTSQQTVDTVSGTYYIYDAIVNGEVVKLNVADKVTEHTLYNGVSYTTYANGAKVAKLSGAVNESNPTNGVDMFFAAAGTDKNVNGAIMLGASWYVAADDCAVFYIDADGTISNKTTSASIAKDADDEVYFKTVNGEVSFVVIDQLPKNGGELAKDEEFSGASYVNLVTPATVLVNYTGTTAPTAKEAVALVEQAILAAGYTIKDTTGDGVAKSLAGTVYTFEVEDENGFATTSFAFNASTGIATGTALTVNGKSVIVKNATTYNAVATELGLTAGTYAKKSDNTYVTVGSAPAAKDKFELGYYKVTQPTTTSAGGVTYTVTNSAADSYAKAGSTFKVKITLSGTSTGTIPVALTSTNGTIPAAASVTPVAGTMTGLTSAVIAANVLTITPAGTGATDAVFEVTVTVGAGNVTFTLT